MRRVLIGGAVLSMCASLAPAAARATAVAPSPSPSPGAPSTITAQGRDVTVDEMDEVSLQFVAGVLPVPVPIPVGHGCRDTSPQGDFGYDVQATFTSSDASATPQDFSGTATYDDGSTAPLTIGKGFMLPSGTFGAGGDHPPFGEPGVHHSTISIHGKDGSSATVSSTISVSDVRLGLSLCPPSRVVAGHRLTGLVGVVLDGFPRVGTADYAVTIEWGDGVTSRGQLALGGPGGSSILINGDHVYASAGRRTITVIAREVDDAAGQFAARASVPVNVVSALPVTGSQSGSVAPTFIAIAAVLAVIAAGFSRRRWTRRQRLR